METTQPSSAARHRPVLVLGVILLWLVGLGALSALLGARPVGSTSGAVTADTADTFQRELTNRISPMLCEAVPTIKKTYRLSDSQLVAPVPDPDGYGVLADPSQLSGLLAQAEDLLDGQTTLLTVETELYADSPIHYYLDETILAMTWKQPVGGCVYTFGEVKIADASQFRRFLADGKYNSGQLYTTTEMAASVNAVLASAGDYYGYRSIGIVVNEGKVYRGRGHYLDTCYIDSQGDLLFTYAGDYIDEASVQAFVDEHDVRFSLSFGPVMILDGQCTVPDDYNSGEINSAYSRAALCQLGPLHYLVVTANAEDPYYTLPRVSQFAQQLQAMGISTAYALDGGQTATIAMDGQVINKVSYGSQRDISDIFYFATAKEKEGA